jgi:hypothetical protein
LFSRGLGSWQGLGKWCSGSSSGYGHHLVSQQNEIIGFDQVWKGNEINLSICSCNRKPCFIGWIELDAGTRLSMSGVIDLAKPISLPVWCQVLRKLNYSQIVGRLIVYWWITRHPSLHPWTRLLATPSLYVGLHIWCSGSSSGYGHHLVHRPLVAYILYFILPPTSRWWAIFYWF